MRKKKKDLQNDLEDIQIEFDAQSEDVEADTDVVSEE